MKHKGRHIFIFKEKVKAQGDLKNIIDDEIRICKKCEKT
jgi:hypothetical protein